MCRSCSCISPMTPSRLWQLTEEQLGELGLPPPFWAFAWAGGQALARYVLDHPETVRGQTRAGRRLRLRACRHRRDEGRRGARRSPSTSTPSPRTPRCSTPRSTTCTSKPATPIPSANQQTQTIILVGDLFYDRDLAPRVLDWLIAQQARRQDAC